MFGKKKKKKRRDRNLEPNFLVVFQKKLSSPMGLIPECGEPKLNQALIRRKNGP